MVQQIQQFTQMNMQLCIKYSQTNFVQLFINSSNVSMMNVRSL